MATTPRRNPILTIFLTVFLDLLGVTIIIPILAPLLKEPDGLLAASVLDGTRNEIYGYLVAVFPFCQFLSAPLLGSMSDKWGRRPVLFTSLFVTLTGYLLFAYGVEIRSLWLLFVGRSLSGLAAGNLSVIYSAVADISTPEAKARNFGLVGVAFGVGFVVGPAIGGLLANDELLPWLSYATPFLFSAALVLLNLALVYFRFPETHANPNPETSISPWAGFANLKKAFTSPALRTIFVTLFMFTFGFAFFTQFIQIYLIDKFLFDEKDIGILFSYLGVVIALTQGGLVRYLSSRFAPVPILAFSLGMLVIAYLLLLVPDTTLGLYAAVPFVAIAQGMATPNLSALLSNSVEARLQGETLGMQQSVRAMGQLLPPVIGGYAVTMALAFPIWLAAASTVVAWLVFLSYYVLRRPGRVVPPTEHE
ncbi:MAG: MFS transporter [Bacteroidetes bacterium]|nr:MAG: MFS transporter [Bacteroidota bacterium]